jgi:hypothetical protein
MLQIPWSQARVLGYPRQHTRSDFIVLVECENVIGPTDPFQNLV